MFDSNNNEKNEWKGEKPQHKQLLTENLVAEVWVSERDYGMRHDWALVRNGKNEGQTYKTARAKDLLEMPLAIAKLAESFADTPTVPDVLQGQLARLSISMYQAIDVLKQEEAAVARQGNGLATNGYAISR